MKSVAIIIAVYFLHQAKPECGVVQKAWLYGVVPAVVDPESSVQEKALESLEQVLLSQVKPYSASRYLDSSQKLAWDLLGLMCHECQHIRLELSKICFLNNLRFWCVTVLLNLIVVNFWNICFWKKAL